MSTSAESSCYLNILFSSIPFVSLYLFLPLDEPETLRQCYPNPKDTVNGNDSRDQSLLTEMSPPSVPLDASKYVVLYNRKTFDLHLSHSSQNALQASANNTFKHLDHLPTDIVEKIIQDMLAGSSPVSMRRGASISRLDDDKYLHIQIATKIGTHQKISSLARVKHSYRYRLTNTPLRERRLWPTAYGPQALMQAVTELSDQLQPLYRSEEYSVGCSLTIDKETVLWWTGTWNEAMTYSLAKAMAQWRMGKLGHGESFASVARRVQIVADDRLGRPDYFDMTTTPSALAAARDHQQRLVRWMLLMRQLK